MSREHKVVSALGPTDVPVAPIAGLCEDESVNEAPFYVMEFVEGPILRFKADAEAFPEEADRRAIGERVVDTAGRDPPVDPDAVGLGDLGRKEDYVARQLNRWQGQWEKSKTRDLEVIDSVHERLAARIPEQGPATTRSGLDAVLREAEALGVWVGSRPECDRPARHQGGARYHPGPELGQRRPSLHRGRPAQ